MGSIGGRSALPFLGAYAMSKFALEAMADSLRVELEPFGIQVSIVEPGTIATAIWTKPQRSIDGVPAGGGELYGERVEQFRRLASERRREPSRRGGRKAVVHALTSTSRRRATSSVPTPSAVRASRSCRPLRDRC